MRKLYRPVVLAVVAALLTSGWAADAAVDRKTRVKKICKLVKDTKGDAKRVGTNGLATPSSDANLDILTADVATNATTITAVIRLAGLTKDDNMAPTGRQYALQFQVGNRAAVIDAVLDPTGTTYYGGDGRGVVDYKYKQVRISVPLTKLDVTIRPGTALKNVSATTFRVGAQGSVALGIADGASTTKTYVAGTPTCVKVGR
jgi:hypothetical protein